MTQKHRFYLKLTLIILLLFAISAAIQQQLGMSLLEMEQLVASYGNIAPIVYSLLLILGLTVPFNPIPDYALVISASLLLKPTDAILATFAAHSISIALNYLIGKKIGFKAIDIVAKNSEMEILTQISTKISVKQVFALRWVLPITAVGLDLVSYAAGMSKMKFSKYFLASIFPWTTYNVLFFTLTGFAQGQSNLYTFLVAGIFVGFSVLVLKVVNVLSKN